VIVWKQKKGIHGVYQGQKLVTPLILFHHPCGGVLIINALFPQIQLAPFHIHNTMWSEYIIE